METSKELERTMLLSHFTIEKDPDAIVWIDSEETLYRVNEAACRLLGYDLEEMVGKRTQEVGLGVDPSTAKEYRTRLRQHGVVKFEQTFVAKDGREIPVEITANLVEFEGKEYFCCFTRDITERRRSEAALRQALHEVEQLKNRLQEENVYLQHETS